MFSIQFNSFHVYLSDDDDENRGLEEWLENGQDQSRKPFLSQIKNGDI